MKLKKALLGGILAFGILAGVVVPNIGELWPPTNKATGGELWPPINGTDDIVKKDVD
ncbi:hypothetical protein ACQKP0_24315 [Heyndrickxia sp. NPDC080065]|uniref:hypothetical protein n=1 Tax=Heyndrickxia sp. NPDC080065 TaxID=3390568 RepID=UPI003D0503B3